MCLRVLQIRPLNAYVVKTTTNSLVLMTYHSAMRTIPPPEKQVGDL